MTDSFNELIYILSCFVNDRSIERFCKDDINELYLNSKRQGVWEMVYISLTSNNIVVPNAYKLDALHGIMENARQVESVGVCLKKLEREGIRYAVLKGCVLAQLYPNPDCRVSSDTDILIDKKDFLKVSSIFRSNDFQVGKRIASSNQVLCKHKSGFRVEIHWKLYKDFDDSYIFMKKFNLIEPYRKISVGNKYEFYTLGITDGFIYTLLHFIRHFLTCGAGIRQLMDILLYIQYYDDKLDWDRIDNILGELNFTKFVNHLFRIASKYLLIENKKSENDMYSDQLCLEFLDDIERGGLFGKDEKVRVNFVGLYREMLYSRKSLQEVQNYNYIYRKLFPRKDALKVTFTYLEKYPLLIPIAWIQRLFLLVTNIKKEKLFITKEEQELLTKRLEFIKKLDMI